MVYFFIEDDQDDQEIFGMAAADVDPSIQCYFAGDGVEALDMLKDESFMPDTIFIDLNMPRMNGNECLTEIRKMDRLRDTPVYIFSTSSDPKLVVAAKQAGANDFLVKPPGLQALADILKQINQHNRTS